jgi:precorrin-2 dehydrogenase/sirohydrochlorin ferrochelatase
MARTAAGVVECRVVPGDVAQLLDIRYRNIIPPVDVRETNAMKRFYPMMVDLTGRRCLVVGGGSVAERKTASLLEGGADVIVVSPDVTPGLQVWAEQGEITYHARPYRKGDAAGCTLVIAATDQEAVNRAVYEEAQACGAWINVVDRPDLCNFTVPSTLRRGQLQIAVSTGGASPTLAKKIRQELEKTYGPEYAVYLNLLKEMRQRIQKSVADAALRHQLMARLVDEEWMALCKTDPEEARRRIESWVEQAATAEISG